MSHPDNYGRRNPAAAIDDQNVRKLPQFMRRQDQPHPSPANLDELDAELGRYIDSANQETVLPTGTVEHLDLVAGLKLILTRLTYSEMKGVAAGLVGDKPITTAGEMADALEALSRKEQAA